MTAPCLDASAPPGPQQLQQRLLRAAVPLCLHVCTCTASFSGKGSSNSYLGLVCAAILCACTAHETPPLVVLHGRCHMASVATNLALRRSALLSEDIVGACTVNMVSGSKSILRFSATEQGDWRASDR